MVSSIIHVQRYGVVKFIGNTAFAEGEWIGVELDEKAGTFEWWKMWVVNLGFDVFQHLF